MSRYDRGQLVAVITAPDGSQYTDLFGPAYIRLVRSLSFNHYRRIGPEEQYNLPKISFKEYGFVDAWWIIGAYNGIVNQFTECTAGILLKIPTLTSIDDYLRAIQSVNEGPSVVVLR